jgi:hypothetical protein
MDPAVTTGTENRERTVLLPASARIGVYKMTDGTKTVNFVAAEFSNGVWGLLSSITTMKKTAARNMLLQ